MKSGTRYKSEGTAGDFENAAKLVPLRARRRSGEIDREPGCYNSLRPATVATADDVLRLRRPPFLLLLTNPMRQPYPSLRCRAGLAILLAIVFGASNLPAAESWADPSFVPPEGLELWLDAAAIPREAEESKRAPLASGQPVRTWPDASGNRFVALQDIPDRQPILLKIGPAPADPGRSNWCVRFDGIDDHVRIFNAAKAWPEFTLFLVSAPHSNGGGFRGFFSCNRAGHRDYESGLTVDMNFGFSAQLSDLNLEGAGFGGAQNLLSRAIPFGQLLTLESSASVQRSLVTLRVDGQPQGQRAFRPASIIADEFTIGARFYENSNGPQRVQGFLQGDIAEILLFRRELSEPEAQQVRLYLDNKYVDLKRALDQERELAAAQEDSSPLIPVADPPPVQMLIPGFSVRELPVTLCNLNNLRYRADGKLYGLGYDGDIWLLSDSDGDELEETATRFFENRGRLRGPIGMQVIPAGHALLKVEAQTGQPVSVPSQARGVVVASKGKVSALLDLDGDDIAEVERVIATGWQEIPQNVDAVGVAIDPRDGAIYFGLGTAAYNNAYLIDDRGQSAFDLASERGTIQRIAPDLSGRTTVCTGVRFTIGMEFNGAGDLFVSDQEGATWLPNGNPFDELLHIRPGQHYGFPPRHPKHLPQVFDEPSEFDFGPQHQSTCGMTFNLPSQPDGPTFGPDAWKGDLLLTGESRGKLYRTRVVKDRAGRYVADSQLIACLSMLAVDCCLSPRGDLLIACHSGGPDWGTGPTGIGKIFRVRFDPPSTPQPTGVWLAGPHELHLRFDTPLDPPRLRNLIAETTISYGEYVAAGDRFESLHPGYAVVQQQRNAKRFELPIHSASVTADRRELILTTAPHRAALSYAIQLPGLGRESIEPDIGTLPQHRTIDLAYSLQGARADWTPLGKESPEWVAILKHPDLSLASHFDQAAAAPLAQILARPGVLTLSTQLDTRGLFSPRVQPGEQLDHDPTVDTFVKARRIAIRGRVPFTVRWGQDQILAQASPRGPNEVLLPIAADVDSPIPLSIVLNTATDPELEWEWQADLQDGTQRVGALPPRNFLLPGAEFRAASQPSPAERAIPELANASWGRGRQVFFGQEANCAKCHLPDASGRRIGPDLANLHQRDFASVQRDVLQPSFAINPDYLGYVVTLTDGRLLTGTLHDDSDHLVIGDREGKRVRIPRDEIDQLQPATVSVMPDGIPAVLGPDKMRDLLAYLMTAPPRMPNDAIGQAPAPRSRAEVDAVLSDSIPYLPEAATGKTSRQLQLLLVGGAKDHGPGEHDYPVWLREWGKLLEAAEGVTVATAMEWPTEGQLRAADTIVFYQRGSWNAERAAAIDAHLTKGGGLVYIHWAVEGGQHAPEFAKRIGLASDNTKLKYRHGPLELGFQTGPQHPIGRNFDKVRLHDESYWQMVGDADRIRVLGYGQEDGMPQPLFWTLEPVRGRIFVSIPGHYSWTFDDPLYRTLLLRGIAWTAGEPVDRFNELITLGITPSD